MKNVFSKTGIFAAAVLAAASMASVAHADTRMDEHTIMSSLIRDLRGDSFVDIGAELGLYSLRGRINSVIVIGATRGGRGDLEIVGDDMVLARQDNVSTLITAMQFPISRDSWRLRSLMLRTHGGFHIEYVGVTIEEMPPIPLPPMISEQESFELIQDVCRQNAVNKQLGKVNHHVKHFDGRRIPMRTLVGTLRCVYGDQGKLDALRLMRATLFFQPHEIRDALELFVDQRAREEARRILESSY